MSVLTFKADRTFLEGKQGKLKTDGKGNFEIIVGAYNAMNNVGETYLFTERVERLFKRSTAIDNLNNSRLFGEAEHPSLDEYLLKCADPKRAIALWIDRLGRIDTARISHQILAIEIVDSGVKKNNRPVMLVKAIIKPLNTVLAACLADTEQNTAFSVRSFVDRTMRLGEVFCEAKDIVTWDWVAKGGIEQATKFKTPGLESAARIITEGAVIDSDVLRELSILEESRHGLESDRIITTEMIKNYSGTWQEVPNLGDLISRRW